MLCLAEPDLTRAQASCLCAIVLLTAERYGLPPSARELGRHLGVGLNAVNQAVVRLRRKGWLKPAGGARTLQLTRPPRWVECGV